MEEIQVNKKNQWYLYTIEYYSDIKIMKLCHFHQYGWIQVEGIMLSEVSQAEKDKYHRISLICMWDLKNKINKHHRNRLIDTENKRMVVRWERVWGAR